MVKLAEVDTDITITELAEAQETDTPVSSAAKVLVLRKPLSKYVSRKLDEMPLPYDILRAAFRAPGEPMPQPPKRRA